MTLLLILYRADHFFKYYVPVKLVVQFELFSLGNGYRHWRMQVVIFGPRLKFCAAMYVFEPRSYMRNRTIQETATFRYSRTLLRKMLFPHLNM